MWFTLIPVDYRGDIVLQGQIAALTAPAEGLHGDAQTRGKEDRVLQVKPVERHPCTRLAGLLDDLLEAHVGRRIVLAETPGAAKVVFCAGAADRGELVIVVEEHLDLALTYGMTADKIPICMFWLGATPAQKGKEAEKTNQPLPSLHSPFFRPDAEPAMETGIKAMTLAVLECLKP